MSRLTFITAFRLLAMSTFHNSDIPNRRHKHTQAYPKAWFKSSSVVSMVLVCINTLALADSTASRQIQVSAHDLRNGSAVVLGDLGLPLGTPVEVEGSVVTAKSVRRMSLTDEYLLVIDTVKGKKLDSVITFGFWVEDSTKSLMVNTDLGLRWLLAGMVEEFEITQEQANKLLRDYTKVRRKLLVFETAVFLGRPLNLPPTAPLRSGPAFGFETHLVVAEPGK